MLRRILWLILPLLSGNIYAYEFPIEIIEYIDNTKVVVFINEEDIDNSQRWSPFKSPPPLTITAALNLMQKQVASDPALAKASLTGIELKPIPHHDDQWHYLVKINTQIDGKSHSHYFFLLMNGKIIAGLKEPETLK